MYAPHYRVASSGGVFRRRLRVFSPTFLALTHPAKASTAEALEKTDKVVLYSRYVEELADSLGGGGPLVFELRNEALGRRTHVGVLEFSSDQGGLMYVPMWIMHALALEDSQEAVLRLVTPQLPSITALHLRPMDPSFMAAHGDDPKGVLEECLRSHTAVRACVHARSDRSTLATAVTRERAH